MHIFFDFDQTLSKYHTVRQDHSALSREVLRSNLKSPEELETFFKHAVASGHSIYIATFHANRAHIEAYLTALLGERWTDYISSVQLADTEERQKLVYKSTDSHLNYRNKNDFIRAGLQENSISLDQLHDEEIVLVDDDKRNLQAANEAVNSFSLRIKTIHAHPQSFQANYIAELNEVIKTSTHVVIPTSPDDALNNPIRLCNVPRVSFFSPALQRNAGLAFIALSTATGITAVVASMLNIANIGLALPIALAVIATVGAALATTPDTRPAATPLACLPGLQ